MDHSIMNCRNFLLGTAAHRRPFGLSLAIELPVNVSVSAVSDADLARWLQPAGR